MVMSKKGRINQGMIVNLVIVLVLSGVLFSVAQTTIPTAASAFGYLMDVIAGNTTLYGTGAATFAGNASGYLGWFWALGPFVLGISIVTGLFMTRRRRR